MIIEIENVFKSYANIPAVRGVSLKIEQGERLVILGPSGCGKTTLLRIVAGFIHPDEGTVVIDGCIAAKNGRCLIEPENRKIGMVFQDLALWPHMSVYGNLEFGLKARKIPKKERRERMDAMLEKVQLTRFKNSFPNDLSGGQQQRVALARALVMEPKILLMDEPLSNLDPDLNLSLRKEILRLQETLGITLLYVTHDKDEAFSLATRIVVMSKGG
jgi:ABC-type Fe3+/spermidine/putrescine transport system ATPase subunit